MQNRLPDNAPGGWFARLIGAIVSVIVMAGLFFLGLTVFAAVAGLALVVFAVLAARVWWLRRRLARHGAAPGTSAGESRPSRDGVTLEGEFEERSSRDRSDR